MKERIVITTIDSLIDLFRDYCPDGDIPLDCKALRLQVNTTDKGKFCIVASSDDWPKGEAPLNITFDMKRVYSV